MKKKERSNKWTGPAHQAAHVPLPLLAWLLPSLSLWFPNLPISLKHRRCPLSLSLVLPSASLAPLQMRAALLRSPLSGCAALLPSAPLLPLPHCSALSDQTAAAILEGEERAASLPLVPSISTTHSLDFSRHFSRFFLPRSPV